MFVGSPGFCLRAVARRRLPAQRRMLVRGFVWLACLLQHGDWRVVSTREEFVWTYDNSATNFTRLSNVVVLRCNLQTALPFHLKFIGRP
jgi:hypothetical protein